MKKESRIYPERLGLITSKVKDIRSILSKFIEDSNRMKIRR